MACRPVSLPVVRKNHKARAARYKIYSHWELSPERNKDAQSSRDRTCGVEQDMSKYLAVVDGRWNMRWRLRTFEI